jgi:hypothetical protein
VVGRPSPQRHFSDLGLAERDGWRAPSGPKEFAPAVQKWLKEHGDTYRIRRFVTEKKDEPKEK